MIVARAAPDDEQRHRQRSWSTLSSGLDLDPDPNDVAQFGA